MVKLPAKGEVPPRTTTVHDARPERGFGPEGLFALIMAASLAAVIVYAERGRFYCDAFHRVEVDGRVYSGGCAEPVDGYLAQVAVMGLAPLATAVALLRRRLSLRRWLGLIALIALELAIIGQTVPGRALAHPHLLKVDPTSGRARLILAD